MSHPALTASRDQGFLRVLKESRGGRMCQTPGPLAYCRGLQQPLSFVLVLKSLSPALALDISVREGYTGQHVFPASMRQISKRGPWFLGLTSRLMPVSDPLNRDQFPNPVPLAGTVPHPLPHPLL